MGFNVYLPAETVIGDIKFNNDIQRCILFQIATNLTILLKITREKHTSEAYLESNQTSNKELFKK